MAAASSLLLPLDLRSHGNFGYSVQFKGLMEKTRLYSFTQLSHSMRHDAWSLYLLSNVHRPISPGCTRSNAIRCQSLLKPGGGNEIPVLKSVAAIISRSYHAFHGSPLVLQLAPAFGIIAFAAWGLGPITRFGRALFLHKSDSSWKKSGTHYVVTSYLQPVLLWTGATLLCRVLDPVILPSVASQAVKQRLLNFVRSLSTVLAFTYCLSSLIQQTQKFFMETKDSSDARNMGIEFAGKAVYTAVWVAAISLFMELLGFSTQKWLTAGGLGTVLLTLAGREIFTNFLSSMMIHATRPFVLNDWIQTKIEGYEVSGTVEHVGWWSPTVIRGDDREAVHIPNHKFTVNVVRNLSQKTHWRIKTHLAISHLDVNKINNIVADMRKVVAKNPQVEQQKLHRRVFLDNVDPENQALLILVSCFVKTSRFEEYLCVKEAVLLDLLRVISHHRARLATPMRTIQKIYSEADVDTVAFAETISRTRAAANHPLLLIEPPYKINNDDKTRTSTRSAQLNKEKDENAEATGASDTKVDAKASTLNTDDNKVDGKIPSGLNSDGSTKAKAVTKSVSDAKLQNMGLTDSNQKKSMKEKPDKVVSKEQGLNLEEQTSEGTGLEKELPAFQELGIDEIDVATSTSQSKIDLERHISSPSKTILEDNIVLGVALEGSKRTLPIEEEMVPPPTPVDGKELAAVGKDKQDEVAEVPSDQREKER